MKFFLKIQGPVSISLLLSGILCCMYTIKTQAQSVTYYKDIAPIIQTKCAPCHKPGEAAPFPLLTYKDVAKRATFIKQVIQTRYMPPWKADPHYVSFGNERRLSDEEIKLITDWVDAKTPEGKLTKKEKDKLPVLVTGTSYNRSPDLTLKVKDLIKVPGDNEERFIVYKIPFELPDSANVEAIEFFCTNKKIIHHANYGIHPVPDTSIDLYNTITSLNLTDDDRRKYDQYLPYKKQIAYYSGWIPGASYEKYPPGFGWVMPKRGVILLTVHFSPLAKEDTATIGVNLFFTKQQVQRTVKVISFGSGGIGEDMIWPRLFIDKNQVRSFRLTLRNPGEDMSILYVWPHMHYIGKVFTAYAVTPDGDTIPLVHIPRWDFRWQEIYRFRHLIKIPRGSTLTIEATYDNTADNPFNPFSPPRPIFSSGDMRSTDEMMTLMMVFLPYQDGDENIKLD